MEVKDGTRDTGPAVEVGSLIKRYGELVAVDGLSLKIPRGQVLGRARSPLLRATLSLAELARSEDALCKDCAGLIELGGETRNVHQVGAHR